METTTLYTELIKIIFELMQMKTSAFSNAKRLAILFAIKENDEKTVRDINPMTLIRTTGHEDVATSLVSLREEIKEFYLEIIAGQYNEPERQKRDKTAYLLATRALALSEMLQLQYYFVTLEETN